MLRIGAFAQLTGLSVKVLRHYDETGVLSPAATDPFTGYRMYGADQARDGATIWLLRRAGVPLAETRVALVGGDPVAVLAAHRARIAAERQAQDQAAAEAEAVFASFAQPAPVTERDRPPLPYAGVVIKVRVEDVETLDDEKANAAFEDLYRQLSADGHQPSGAFWTSLRESTRGWVEVSCCWALSEPLPGDWGGADIVTGVLPERRELVAIWQLTDDTPPGAAMHPAALALIEANADRADESSRASGETRENGANADGLTVRQQVRYDLDPPVVELSMPLA
ncbi:MerR family DNA-binding transcriptional regulator [Brevibacterium sp. p3-SID960]|uniref:MerR family DNA-binding transcriptional regulator n=1 Tax=Brevibacterium sp. p3-SID960 TaxID=2916063 RepID=UPI0021A5AA1B|nr:MerR family DNA-binding transcriptional regulator [Brevibacterium sp. p3-SID960]MCT1690726.1 MerR family DNA-binding transcriptional regulator [Brevibacterium sp. p3-SID960]